MLVKKPPVILLLDSCRNNISSCNSSIKIFALAMQEMNTQICTPIYKDGWNSKDLFLVTNVRKSLNIKYCDVFNDSKFKC